MTLKDKLSKAGLVVATKDGKATIAAQPEDPIEKQEEQLGVRMLQLMVKKGISRADAVRLQGAIKDLMARFMGGFGAADAKKLTKVLDTNFKNA